MKMGIYEATPWKTNMDTQSFGLFPKATPFEDGHLWYLCWISGAIHP